MRIALISVVSERNPDMILDLICAAATQIKAICQGLSAPSGNHATRLQNQLSGRKAMEILKDGTPFDAITLDLHLPGVPGTEIYDMLEKRGDANRVLVVSAYLGDIKDFEIRGVNALEKPVKIEDLVERVTEIVEHPSADDICWICVR